MTRLWLRFRFGARTIGLALRRGLRPSVGRLALRRGLRPSVGRLAGWVGNTVGAAVATTRIYIVIGSWLKHRSLGRRDDYQRLLTKSHGSLNLHPRSSIGMHQRRRKHS